MVERNKFKTLFLILKEINSNDHITAANITDKLKVSYKHIFSLLKEMEEEDLIKKTGNKDARVWLLFLTDKGKKKLKAYSEIFGI